MWQIPTKIMNQRQTTIVTEEKRDQYSNDLKTQKLQESLKQKRDIIERATSKMKADEISIMKRISEAKLGHHVRNAHPMDITCVIYISEKDLICTGSEDKRIRVWSNLDLKETLTGHSHGINSLIKLKHGNCIASCSRDHTIRIWDLGTMQNIQTLTEHNNSVNTIILLSNSGYMLSGSHDHQLIVWKQCLPNNFTFASGYISPTTQQQRIYSIVDLSHGIIAVGRINTIAIYSLLIQPANENKSWVRLQFNLRGHHDDVLKLTGYHKQTLLSCSADETCKLWSILHRRCLKTYTGHAKPIYCILSMKPNMFISASNGMRIWRLYSGESYEIGSKEGYYIFDICKEDDSKLLVVGESKKLEYWWWPKIWFAIQPYDSKSSY